jgi:hypothetical protein
MGGLSHVFGKRSMEFNGVKNDRLAFTPLPDDI